MMAKRYGENKDKNLNFMENLYFFVDESLGNYCKNKYINKLKGENLNDLIKKDGKINEDYKDWIIENYFSTEETSEDFEQKQK